MAELLVELLSEEIPARMQARAADDFKRLVTAGLAKARLAFTAAQAFVTPRRLVLVVAGLPERQPDIEEERKGPRVGAPEKAIEGFLKATGLASIAEAKIQESGKGSFYFAVRQIAGQPALDALAGVLAEAIAQMPWPKSMRWGAGSMRWVRPLQNILAILDGQPLPWTVDCGGSGERAMQLSATDATRGHRFLAPDPFKVASFADYQAKLAGAKVILDPASRRQVISERAEAIAAAEGLTLKPDPGLLDEVTGLVEWPVVLMGRIDESFMTLPPEVLTTAMRAHQKYFALNDGEGRLAPRFIVVANMETPDAGRTVVAGNERVLRARLSDAQFFWDHDRKRPLAARVEKLSERVFHARLGSDLARTERLEKLARDLARSIGADPELSARAARLCKADLTTGLVGEFPELQGVMGRYYALNDGEPADVANAIAQHYAPLGPSDRCPTAPVAATVALADKLDTLTGFFGIGEKPTGSGDPYALRRAALGVIRLIVENSVRLGLRAALLQAATGYADSILQSKPAPLADDILSFFADRLKVHLREQGVRHDLIAAVFATGTEDDLVRLLARVEALRGFLNTDDGANVLVAYRRASNIVRIEENREGVSYGAAVDPAMFAEPEETDLYSRLTNAHEGIAAALTAERFGEAMSILAKLRAPVDAFFDRVTVNCTDAAMRANRLRLLSRIRLALGDVADFSQIEG
ncbi:Glycine--tRNA ligase beta subunit [Candidatus Defluviicoccus seviourii]|uniref:Glycine--tRNA ligase beta subunit n=1 Tax=Candidatus Defluviicoccus seviourii TaxID=2565273 RepID=A0A564WCH2_9PROT|nr:Glycine--tRNA ligase beta subunit [Candidatus Defluviicoccus seviourii]